MLVGADDDAGLLAVLGRLAEFLDAAPAAPLGDIAYTMGIAARNARLAAAVVAESVADLRTKLATLHRQLTDPGPTRIARRGLHLPRAAAGEGGRIAFVFPGEGSQYPRMLRNICLSMPECLRAFDEVEAASLDAGGIAPSRWIFPLTPNIVAKATRDAGERVSVAEGVLAVLAADTAYARLLQSLDIRPDGAIGAGVGEIAALECAGVFSFADDPRARLRALGKSYLVMRDAADAFDPSATVQFSISGIPHETFLDVLSRFPGEAEPTRRFGPRQFAACVKAPAAEAASRAFRDAGGIVRRLPFNRPFHTPWFASAVPELAQCFDEWIVRPPEIPVYSCATGLPLPDDLDALRKTALDQWIRPVDFASSIERMYADGFRIFIEVGARGILSSGIDAQLEDRPHLAVPMNRVHRGGLSQVNNALAALAAWGVRFDVSPLHIHRGSREIDLSKPAPWRRAKPVRRLPLDTALPALRLDPGRLPAELHAAFAADAPSRAAADPAKRRAATPPRPEPAESSAPPPAPAGVEVDDSLFPLLASSRVIAEEPGTSIVLRQPLSFFDLPILKDCTFGAEPVAVSDPLRRGLPLVPLAFCAELMAETARRIVPDLVPVRVDNLHLLRWIPLITARRVVRLSARRSTLPGDASGTVRFDTAILDGSGEDGTRESAPLARMSIVFAPAYPGEAAIPPPPPLDNPRKTALEGDKLHAGLFFNGPGLRVLKSIVRASDNGVDALVDPVPPPKDDAPASPPRYSVAPFLLAAIGHAQMAWRNLGRTPGPVPLGQAIRRLDLATAVPTEGPLSLRVLARPAPAEGLGAADAWVRDARGTPILAAQGFETRLFPLPEHLRQTLLHPIEGFLSHPLPAKALPSLSHEVVCRVADGIPPELLDDPQELWIRATAATVLSADETTRWRDMTGSIPRRHEWLMGRIAAKDAVRHCLLSRYNRKWAAADISIDPDEAGKPVPQGEWRRHCGARMDISITHNPDLVMAAAAPNACVGLDVERCNRSLSDSFIDGAFSPDEQEIAAESGEGSIALVRFWSAKEALAKALGTGLRYGAANLQVFAYDPAAGRIELELTRLWTEFFPHLRGERLVVHTGILGNCILSVCVLPPEAVRSDDENSRSANGTSQASLP